MTEAEAWTTPVFAVLRLEYPDLVWDQPTATAVRWGGEVVRVWATGPLTTL